MPDPWMTVYTAPQRLFQDTFTAADRTTVCCVCRLEEWLQGAIMLPSGVAASTLLEESSIRFASAIVSDDGILLGAACIEFRGNSPEQIVIF